MKKTLAKKISLCLYSMLFIGCVAANGATEEEFKTPEYWNSTGLDLMNAARAYALGYTGKGITIGMADDYAKLMHPEFAGKTNSWTIGIVPTNYNWAKNNHGTHVAGTMLANKDGIGMHGVAFESNLVSGGLLFGSSADKFTASLKYAYDFFNSHPEIKVINNSWNQLIYVDETGLETATIADWNILRTSMTDYDKVLVFAAHNFGHSTPALLSIIPSDDNDSPKNFLNVVAVNVEKLDQTTNEAQSGFIGSFSDLTKYAEEYSIAAPGYQINSANAENNGYVQWNGTSMAAPHVSGAIALVQEAFPYMNGQQLVDTVLSSTNNTFTLPKLSLSVQKDGDNKLFNIYYHDDKPNDQGEITSDLEQYYDENAEALAKSYGISSKEDWQDILTKYQQENKVRFYENVPREMIFGQGILDVGAAVQGPGLFNARRMNANNFDSSHGNNQALYKINTAGYNSVWSNNIGEKRAGLLTADSTEEDLQAIHAYYLQNFAQYGMDNSAAYIDNYNAVAAANRLINLPVGLLKLGQGTLALTGANTYTGTSVVAGGVLQIDGSVAGDAWSDLGGTLAGSGTIQNSLVNYGTVQAGSWGKPGTLNITGNFDSYGNIAVATDSATNSLLSVTGTANLHNSKITKATGSIYIPEKKYTILAASSIAGAITPAPFSGMLNSQGTIKSNNLIMELTRNNNLEATNSMQQQTYSAIDNMYENLMGNTRQREMDILYNLDATPAKQALTEAYGGTQSAMITNIQQSPINRTAVNARLSQVKRTENMNIKIPLNGFSGNIDSYSVLPLELDSKNSWWLKMSKGWGQVYSTSEGSGSKTNGFAVSLGRDAKLNENFRLGGIFSYGTNTMSTDNGKGENKDYRLGIYSNYNKQALDLSSYLSYGWQSNEATRYLRTLGLQADAKYNSNTFELGMRTSYNLQHDKEKVWQISPYGELAITRYEQNDYNESGAGIFGQKANRYVGVYSTLETGINLGRKIKNGSYDFNLGYKYILSGANPNLQTAFIGNPSNEFSVTAADSGKHFLVLGARVEGKLAKDWILTGEVRHEQSSQSKYTGASMMLKYVW